MSSPLTFTTEAERLKAREQHLHLCRAIYPGFEHEVVARDFDSRFPPIAPPRMVPLLAWARLDENDGCYGVTLTQPSEAGRPFGHRFARVRVVEVDDA